MPDEHGPYRFYHERSENQPTPQTAIDDIERK